MKKKIIGIAIMVAACSQYPKDVENIPQVTFDVTKLSAWTVDSIECKFIPLETNDDCLLATLVDVKFYKDKIFILDGYQKGQALVFELNGKFITRIGHWGDGPGGYLMPQKIHIDEENKRITVVDARLNRLNHYQLENFEYIDQQKAFNYTNCAWLADGNILWYESIGFDTGKRKYYSIYITNTDLEKVVYLKESKEFSPYMVAEHSLFQYDHQTYISFPFSPLIYRVSSEKIEPVWKLSFGKQEFPSDDYVTEIIKEGASGTDRLLRSDYVNSFSACETDEYMAVTYYSKNFDSYLGFYNKRTNTTQAFSMEEFVKRFGVTGGKLILGRHGDYFLMVLNAKRLKDQPTFREDLKQITDKMTEEDNPVLCLFKFKE